uniref:Uncharacterized protein n=1 Tax=viral metagenome TaxID=1070528 RepID=A0A6M3KUI9_9ZZZZ
MKACPKCKGQIVPCDFAWECTECDWHGKIKKISKQKLNKLIKMIKEG